MFKSRRSLAVLLAAAALVFAVLPASSAGAASPWWQVVTGSRPSNLWIPKNEVQKIEAPATAFVLAVNGTNVGTFNTGPLPGTAANVQTALESAYGAGNVIVTGGPAGTAPLLVTTVGGAGGRYVSPVQSPFGATTSVVQPGGSGNLVLTITNLGDAPVNGTSTPVKVVDQLPAGIEAVRVEGFAGVQDKSGPVDCTIENPRLVSCLFEGTLPSYEAIEVEVFVNLIGGSPAVSGPGIVNVSGGNAAAVSVAQDIHVSPEPVHFGIERFSARAEEEGGGASARAGAHPFQLSTTVQLNSGPMLSRFVGIEQPAQPRNIGFALPAGFVGNTTAVSRCSMDDFYDVQPTLVNVCPDDAAIGVSSVTMTGLLGFIRAAVPVFNLPPAPGEPARFGFLIAGDPIVIDTAVDPENEYRVIATVTNASQLVQFLGSTVSLWGTPGDPRHDSARGWNCAYHVTNLGTCERPADLGETAFLRQPVRCSVPLDFRLQLEPWNAPLGTAVQERPFDEPPLSSCNQVPFDPFPTVTPSDRRTDGATGLNFDLRMPNAGLLDKDAIAEGQAKKVEVTLPEGVTVNPSAANGLGACTPAEYARERFDSPPGDGCPESSKIGSVDITTPLLDEEAHGSAYVASPHDNPFGSLLALYMVAKIPERGILVKQAGKVSLDPSTGQIVTTFDDLPQIPFDTFDLHFKEGDQAPLVMPSACGKYDIVTRFTPWHASNPDNPLPSEIVTRSSTFSVDRGPNGGPCPSGTPPFKPGFSAGTVNNAAGSYSPFDARLTREDGEQEFTRFSMKLPKGLIGKLAGIPFCPEAAIAAARARTGSNGGQEELEHPSCPGASEIGRTLVGAGVGSTLTYAPGRLYLAGPYRGSKLSVVAITTAKVGPFDLGTVVIRQALRIDPDTAQVTADGSGSEPIPHILQGVVVHARDIRIYVDRKDFVLNPTSCERMRVGASVAGSGQPVEVSAPFQAADCAGLGFKPKLSLSLRGGTKRGDNPRLKAVVRTRRGDADIGAAVVTLPHSAFLDQAHIRTVCTRVQFNAGDGNGEKCPKGSIYGRVRAVSPLLDEPLRGPVYLRSSNHPLPDLVAALHSGKVDINLDGRIDSVGNGRIRNIFQAVPDAPVTRFTLEMQGGRKGLLVNSTNICLGNHRARATFTGQNGKRRALKPLVKAKCGGKKH